MNRLFGRRMIGITYGILALLLLIGSLADQQISSVLYHPHNAFGIVFAAFGELPLLLCCWSGGYLIVRHGRFSLLLRVPIGLYLFYASLVSLYEAAHFLPDSLSLWGVLAETLIGLLTLFLLDRLGKDIDSDTLFRLGVFLALTALLQYHLIRLIKTLWGRPRWRAIVRTEGLSFQPWWRPNTSARDHFVPAGLLTAGEFRSFPSGHSGNAALSFALVPLVAALRPRTGRRALITSALWAGLLMLSRIVLGAHFLSDVTVGVGITLTLVFLLSRLILSGIPALPSTAPLDSTAVKK